MNKIIIRLVSIPVAALALAGLAANPASADVVAMKVSKTSERAIRLCNDGDGRGGCSNFKPGRWAVKVGSARQDAGCEFWESGKRKYKRLDHVTYRNYTWDRVIGKRTIALRNCRNTGRGDKVVPTSFVDSATKTVSYH